MFYQDEPISVADWQKRDLYSKLLTSKRGVTQAVKKLGNIYTKSSKRFKGLMAIVGFLPILYVGISWLTFSVKSLLPAVIFVGISFAIYIIAFAVYDESQKKTRNKKSVSFISSLIFIAVLTVFIVILTMAFNLLIGADINVLYLIEIGRASCRERV